MSRATATVLQPVEDPADVFYPETDGKPMAETDVHYRQIVDVREALTEFYRDEAGVYVSGNLLLYYEEGEPHHCVSPDVLVTLGIPKGERRVYKL